MHGTLVVIAATESRTPKHEISSSSRRGNGPVPVRERLWLRVAAPVACVGGLALWYESLKGIHPYSGTALGISNELPAAWWLGLLMVVAAIATEAVRQRPRSATLFLGTVSLAVILHGTLPAVETAPRFDAAYSIAGFTNQLARTGITLPLVDARMSWPSLFAGAGMAARAMGIQPIWFLRWAPLVLNLVYLLPLKVIANATLREPRAQWLALSIFLAGNWIDQDYFSPQGVDLFLYLAVIAILVKTFSTRRSQPAFVRRVIGQPEFERVTHRFRVFARMPNRAAPVEELGVALESTTSFALFALILLVCAAIVTSHQFTPLALCVVLVALAAVGRIYLKTLWLIVAVFIFAWLSWLGYKYWAGHLSQIFGGVGQVNTVISSSVNTRLASASPDRLLVQHSRIAVSIVIWAGALFSFWWHWRRGVSQWTLFVLMATPALVALANSYGGEVALRILLFSLAPGAILIAGLTDSRVASRISLGVFVAIAVVLLGAFPLVRYGNEGFEAMAPSDVSGAAWISQHVPAGSVVLVANADSPMAEYVAKYQVDQLSDGASVSVVKLRSALQEGPSTFWIYIDRSQKEYGTIFEGLSPTWSEKLIEEVMDTGLVSVVYRNATSVVLKVAGGVASADENG